MTEEVIVETVPTEVPPVVEIDDNLPPEIEGAPNASSQEADKSEATKSSPEEKTSGTAEEGGTGQSENIPVESPEALKEKYRADKLQAELDRLTHKPNVEPVADNFATNEEYINALVEHRVKEQSVNITQQQKSQQTQESYNVNVSTFATENNITKEAFDVMAGSIPELPQGVAGAIMTSDLGPKVIQHLAGDLGLAYKMAAMTPIQALVELGKLQASVSTVKPKEPTKAPSPTKTIANGAGVTRKDVGGDMSMDDWMKEFN